MLIINMEGMIAGALIGGIYFMLSLVFPGMEYPVKYSSVAALFLIIGTVADTLGYQPRIYYAKFKLVGIVLTILGVFMFLGVAGFILAFIVSAICLTLWNRNRENKAFLHAQSSFEKYLANQEQDPHARKRLLLEALFQNVWLQKKPEFFLHNDKVLNALISDVGITRNEDELHYLHFVRDTLQEQQVQTKRTWKLKNIEKVKFALTQSLDNQGIGRFRPAA
ncbi:hypothetical protein [Undibacterium sp. TC9W]|uniref:hypothetical protein n=1 Tax=Undibacterium sp. TC9W TaxID=3413053 RepID=UPI003BF3A0CE